MGSSAHSDAQTVDFSQFLSPEHTMCDLRANSRKRALELAANQLVARRVMLVDTDTIFNALMARERLGTTALGEGVALPHCRLATCTQPIVALIRLAHPVDFDAPDGELVDLLFVLLVPSEAHETHLKLLASAAQALQKPDYREALRSAVSDVDLYEKACNGLCQGA